MALPCGQKKHVSELPVFWTPAIKLNLCICTSMHEARMQPTKPVTLVIHEYEV